MEFNGHKCNLCDKLYKNYQSLWNHKHKYHKSPVSQKLASPVSQKLADPVFPCEYCRNVYKHKSSRSKHYSRCGIKKNHEKEINQIKEKMVELENKINQSNQTNNTTNNNSGTIINGDNNKVININGLGYEDILKKLTKDEKIDLLSSLLFKEIPVVELIRKIYNNDKFIEDRNTMITNLQSKTCLAYNQETEKFEAKNKNTHIDDIIDYRNNDIKKMMDEMKDSPKIKNYTRSLIEDYIDNTDEIKKTLAYKKYKEEIIYIIYNCKDFMKKLYQSSEKNSMNQNIKIEI